MRVPALLLAALAGAVLFPSGARAADAPDDRLRTVILGINARRGVDDKQLAQALTDVVQGIYAADPRRVVIGRDDIARVLDLEAQKQQAGCESDKCLAEIGAALDAKRIVTGSIDVIGSNYMVTMSEIDAKSLEPMARVQERTAKDENALVDAVTRLAADMLAKSKVGGAARVIGNAGSVEITSDPRGAEVLLGGEKMGSTPTRIDNLTAGEQKLRLLREDYEPVEVAVPIHPGGTTKVDAELRILRPLAEKNFEVRKVAYEEDLTLHNVGAWSKVGGGMVLAGLGSLFGVTQLLPRQGIQLVPAIGGFGVGGLGGALAIWGVVDLVNPPPPPVPEWEVQRKVTVTPPAGAGEQRVQLLQDGGSTER
ncbi:MAG: PEGA domain-containing protein [Deltaproteobacteria bacterium]|nr:PEGA domain-containing protein [Deltaproteobacteria bacterium]